MVVKQDKVPFEDALRMAGFGKYNLLSFGLCSSIIMGMTFEIFSVSYLVPGSACELHTTSSQQGLMAAVPLIGIILTSHVWGFLADSRGRRKILVLSMVLALITGSLAALSPNWIVLSVLKLFSSAAVSGAYALGLTLMSEFTLIERRSTLVLLTTTVFLSCIGLMAVLSIPILPLKFSYYIPYLDIQFNSWRVLDLLYAFPCAIGALGVFLSYESPKYLLSVGRHEEALKVLKRIFAINSGQSEDLYRVRSIVLDEEAKVEVEGLWASIKAQTLPMLQKPLLKDSLLLSLLMFIVYFCINSFFVWLPFIVDAAMKSVEDGGTNLTLCEMIRYSRNITTIEEPTSCSMNKFAMLVVFSFSMFVAVFNLIVSGVTPWIGRKTLVVGSEIIGGLAAIYINFSYNWVVTAICFMVYLTGIINFASLTSYCVELYPTYVKAMAVCITLMIGRGSAILGINLVKNMLDSNCEAAFYLFGAVYIAGGFCALFLPTDKQILQRHEVLKTKLSNVN